MEQKTYGVWAVRGSGSIFGHAEAWCKEDGRPIEFDSEAAAKTYASELNGKSTANVHYYVKEKEPEIDAVKFTADSAALGPLIRENQPPRDLSAEKRNEITGRQIAPEERPIITGQPFKKPENYLRNAELYMEGQTGNYNQLNGIIDNKAPERPDLTDGQTFDELRELAPETLPEEKQSILDQLKAERPEHEPRQLTPSDPERER